MGLLDKLTKKDADKSTSKKEATVEAPKKSTKTSAKQETTIKKSAVSVKGPAHKVILKPLVSEKATGAEMLGQYTFLVNKNSNKTEIKKAVKNGAKISYFSDPKKAAKDADVLITDTWFSMGDVAEKNDKLKKEK